MNIYHVLINALSTHMIHINLNTIFYTHIEHSPSYQNNLHKVFYRKSHTHTHIHTNALQLSSGAACGFQGFVVF